MSLIKLVTPVLEEKDVQSFREYIAKDKLNSARLLVERNMIGLDTDDPKHIILNEVYDEIINEIETLLDEE